MTPLVINTPFTILLSLMLLFSVTLADDYDRIDEQTSYDRIDEQSLLEEHNILDLLPKQIYIFQKEAYLLQFSHENSPILAEFPFGTRFKVLGKTEEWYHVSIDNITGYLSEYNARSFYEMSKPMRKRIKKILNIDKPLVKLAPGDTVFRRDSIHVYALEADGLGDVAKKEWRIGSGPFIETDKTDTLLYVPLLADSNFVVIYRVTDNNGIATSDTAHYHVLSQTRSKAKK